MNKVCTAIRDVFERIYPEHKNNHAMLVFTTSYALNMETLIPKKFSYHIVMRDFYFDNHEDMHAFGMLVKAKLDDDLTQCVDPIWTKVRQMRLMGSSKMGCLDGKFFLGLWASGELMDDNCTALESIISNTNGCTRLSRYE